MEMDYHSNSSGLIGRQTQENKGNYFKKYYIIKRVEKTQK